MCRSARVASSSLTSRARSSDRAGDHPGLAGRSRSEGHSKGCPSALRQCWRRVVLCVLCGSKSPERRLAKGTSPAYVCPVFVEGSPTVFHAMQSEPTSGTVNQEELKRAVAVRAAALVEEGMILGLGTGSTVRHLLDAIAERRASGE